MLRKNLIKIISVIALFVTIQNVNAQTVEHSSDKTKILFIEGSWKEILELAVKENKPIFVDCYTVWCGPCKQLDAQVFTNPLVAEYFNSTFINVKIDMEKGEGIDLKNQYEVKAFPTLLYLDKKGNVINRIVGALPADEFLQASKKGMSEHGLSAMTKRYENGEREEEFINDYLKILDEAYLKAEAQIVVEELFSKLDKSALKERKNWDLFAKYIVDYNSDAFQYVHKNREDFYALFGKEQVDIRMFAIWSLGSRSFITKTKEGVTFDSKGFDNYVNRMRKEKAEQQNLIIINAELYNAEQLKNWQTYISIAQAKIEQAGGLEKIPIMELYNWGIRVNQGCEDIKLREKTAQWFSKLIPIIEKADKSSNMAPYLSEYRRLAKELSKEMVK